MLLDAHHKAIARLVKLEALRDSYRRIRALRNLSTGRSISSVEYTTPSGNRIVTDQHEVEQVLSGTLSKRFCNAHGSPFLHSPLVQQVGLDGTGPAAQAILQGTFVCPPGTDTDTRYFIEALQFPSQAARHAHISAVLRPADFIAHWRRAKERTSSSPSGLHFGHYKAATHLPLLAHLHARFTQLVFMTGLSISRYQAGLQVILEKKAGNIHVDNLRAILLMEGDFNGAMKIFIGARMIQSAQALKLIPSECYGSRPGCTALQVSLNRALTADTARQSRATLAVASVDFRTCYDSVGHPPASIASQRLGAPSSVLSTIFRSIQNMRIFLRTAHGDSTSAYGGPPSSGLPFQGVCQGNGAGPALWLATSIPLIENLRRHGHLSTFTCPVSGTSTSQVGLIFVDDCDLLAFGSHPTPVDVVVAALQHNVLLWQGSIRVTGGSLAENKCSWGLLAYQRRGNRWLLHNDVSSPTSLFILDATGQRKPIRRIGPQEGLSVVGVVQALSGNPTPAITALRAKADSWLSAIRSHFLPRPLLWTAVEHVLWPSLRYPLAVMSLNQTQAHSLTSRLYQTLLPRLGVNRHFPVALRHADTSFLGLGLPHPYWEHGIAATRLFLEHANATNTETVLLQVSLEYLHLEVGSWSNVFDLPYDSWSFLATPCWLTNLWRFIDFAKVQFQPSSPVLPPPPRLDDGALMVDVLAASLPRPTILAINRCRIAHHVLYWSDVANGWGDAISESLLSPNR